MKSFSIAILLLTFHSVNGTDCKTFSKEEIYNQADLVFLGKIIYVSDTLASVEIIELFKGSANDTILWLTSNGGIKPRLNSTWLIYGYKAVTKNTFYVGDCGGSKSFDAPRSIHDNTIPSPPTPEMMLMNSQGRILHEQMLLDRALNEFYFDVASLRAKKILEETRVVNKEYARIEKKHSQLANDLHFIKWAIIILTIVILGSTAINFRKR
jgi:hypothetical protein